MIYAQDAGHDVSCADVVDEKVADRYWGHSEQIPWYSRLSAWQKQNLDHVAAVT